MLRRAVDPKCMKTKNKKDSIIPGRQKASRKGAVVALLSLVALVAAIAPSASAATRSTSVTFISPTSSSVSGSVLWRVGFNGSVARVNFTIDNSGILWSEWGAPYLFNGDTGKLDTTTLSNGSHTLRVVALDSRGRTVATGSKVVTVANSTALPPPPPPPSDTQLPTAPSALSITASSTSALTMAWNRATDNVGVAGYRVYSSSVPVATTTATAYTLAGLACGSAYTVGVDAFDAAGNVSSRATLFASTAACTTTTPPPPPPPPTSGMPVFAAPAFTPTRTIVATTRAQFDSAWSGLQPGDYLDVRGVSFSGEAVFAKALSSWAEVHFDSNVHFLGAGAGSRLPAVWAHDSQNVRFFGGDITGAGNDGIRFDDNTNVLWWNFNVHDTAGTGVTVRGLAHSTSGLDLRGTISKCGYDLSLDPHAEKGTGNHAFNMGTGTGQLVTNSRFVLTVHDQAYGAAVEVQGGQNSKLYLDARNITFKAVSQTGGNAVQFWGDGTRGLDIPYLYADTLVGQAVMSGGLNSTNSGITVDYARATNVQKTPEYSIDSAIWYGDVS